MKNIEKEKMSNNGRKGLYLEWAWHKHTCRLLYYKYNVCLKLTIDLSKYNGL